MTCIFFIIAAIESALLTSFYYYSGSVPSEQVFLGLSPQRLVLVFFLLCLTLFFLVLAGLSANRKSGFNTRVRGLLENEQKVRRVLFAGLLFWVISLLLLTSGAEEFGDFKAVYIQFQPILSWAFWICLQTTLVMLLWMGFRFNSSHPDPSTNARKEIRMVGLIFLASAALKVLWGIRGAYGPVSGDEMEYFSLAYYLGQGNIFLAADPIHYPPLYPAFLVTALPFGIHTFDLIKMINVLLSSSIVFPIYLIARQYMDARKSAWAAAAACLLPFHLVFPRRIQSENLYFPLFYWAIYMVTAAPKASRSRPGWDLLSGMCLGLLYLTRYITLATLPAFILGWWLKADLAEGNGNLFSKIEISRFALLLGGVFLVYSPWVVSGVNAGFSLRDMLGLFITAYVENSAQLDFAHLLKWVIIYGAYLVLMTAPLLHLIILFISQVFSKDSGRKVRGWFFTAASLAAVYCAAVVRHSWRANYNAELPMKIMGRYLVFLAPLFLITAMLAAAGQENHVPQPRWKILLSGVVLPAVLISAAYLVVIEKSIIPIDVRALNELGAVDGFLVSLLDWRFFAILLPVYLFCAYFEMRKKRGNFMIVLSIGVCVFYLLGLPAYYEKLQPAQKYSLTGKQVAELLVERFPQDQQSCNFDLLLPNSLTSVQKQMIYTSIQIRGFFELTPASYISTRPLQEISKNTLILWENGAPWLSDARPLEVVELPGQAFQLLLFQ